MVQHCNRSEQEAACSVREWSWTAVPSAVMHDISVVRQCNRSSPLETMIE